MPRISQFLGIIIAMYYDDHPPPHFHARYAEHEATIVIETLEVLEGRLPRHALSRVLKWAEIHQAELRDNWILARQGEPLNPVEPLK